MGRIEFSMTSRLMAGARVYICVSKTQQAWDQLKAYRDRKASRHSVKVVGMLAHGHDLRDDSFAGPLYAKYFSELFEVLSGCLSYREDSVTKPAHAEIAKLLIEEFHTKLARKKRNVVDNGQSHAPLLVFGQLNNGREERLRKKIDADDCGEQSVSCRVE